MSHKMVPSLMFTWSNLLLDYFRLLMSALYQKCESRVNKEDPNLLFVCMSMLVMPVKHFRPLDVIMTLM